MTRHRPLWTRAAVLLTAAAVVLLVAPARAGTAVPAGTLGSLTISPASGTVTNNPMLASVTTSAACPTGYGTNAVAKVGPRNGPYNNLNRIGSDNNYDQGAFTLTTNRSFTTALGGTAPANGVYEIVVQCTGEILGDNASLFVTTITVSGTQWTVGGGAPTTAPTNAGGQGGGSLTLTATIAPGPTTAPATTKTSPPPQSGGGLPTTGTAVAVIVGSGLVLLAAGVFARYVARRRRVET